MSEKSFKNWNLHQSLSILRLLLLFISGDTVSWKRSYGHVKGVTLYLLPSTIKIITSCIITDRIEGVTTYDDWMAVRKMPEVDSDHFMLDANVAQVLPNIKNLLGRERSRQQIIRLEKEKKNRYIMKK